MAKSIKGKKHTHASVKTHENLTKPSKDPAIELSGEELKGVAGGLTNAAHTMTNASFDS